jgi:hypothetical protein
MQRGFGGQIKTPGKGARVSTIQHQGERFMKHSIVNRMPFLTAVAGIVLALAGFAHAGVVGTERPHKAEKAKKGTLNLKVATEVAGVTLEPGEYEVKLIDSKTGPVVRFTLYTYNPYVEESQSPHQWDVVAEVRVTMRALDTKAARTQLVAGSNSGRPIGLEIRSNSFQYLFATA